MIKKIKKYMERNFKNMLWAAAGMLVVALMGLSSCTKDDMREVESSLSKTEFIPSSTPTPTPVEWSHKKDSVNNGNSYEFEVVATEYYSEAKDGLKGSAKIALKEYDYFIQEDQINLSVEYANEHRTMGDAVINGKSYSRSASFAHEDGNITTVSVDIRNGELYKETVKDIVLTSIVNVAEASTRAQYVSQVLNTEMSALVTFVAEYNGISYEYSQELSDKCIRRVLSDDEIVKREIIKNNELIDNSSEFFELSQIVTMKSGEKKSIPASVVVAPIELKTVKFDARLTEYPFNTWVFEIANPISIGEETFLKEEGAWTVYYREDTYTNRYVNNSEHMEFVYTLGHCRAVYNDGTVQAEWEYKPATFTEVSILANLQQSDREGYEAADLVNTVKVSYFGGDQNASEDVVLYKEVAPEPEPVVESYWDETTLIDIITDNFRKVSITWITTTDGVITDSQVYEKEFPRTLVCQSDWSVEADDFNQNTTGLKAVLSKSTPSSDGAWSWDAEAYTIAENATGTGWTKSNSWASTEANGISVTRDGKTYHFADKSVAVSSAATVDGSGNYTSRLNYVFGDNTKYSDAPGKINQKAAPAPEPDPFFPKNWGKILGATQTVAPNETHEGYVYTLVFRFENGTLGVKMNGGESEINWDNWKYFTTSTDQSINGMSYLKGQNEWMFVSADDYADALTYVQTNGQMVDNIAYPKAKSLGWDEGHLVNNHASVYTSRYSMSIVDNVITISDTYTGVNYGSFDSAK